MTRWLCRSIRVPHHAHAGWNGSILGFEPRQTNNLPNHYKSIHSRSFHSDGFPTDAFPNVNAFTELWIHGYYNGYATCSFTHSYDGGAIFYPNLHWRDDCYYL